MSRVGVLPISALSSVDPGNRSAIGQSLFEQTQYGALFWPGKLAVFKLGFDELAKMTHRTAVEIRLDDTGMDIARPCDSRRIA